MNPESYPRNWEYEERVVRAITRHSSLLWVFAILTFGVGDVVTTVVGLSLGAVESHPLGDLVLGLAGVPGMIAWKAGTFVLFAGFAALTPRQWRVGIPIGVVLWGTVVTTWNLVIVAHVL